PETAGRVRQHDPVVTRLRVSEVVLQHVVQRRVVADLERDLTTVGEATHPLAETIRRLVGGDLDGVPLLFGTGNVGGLTDQVKGLRGAAVSALEPGPEPRVASHFRDLHSRCAVWTSQGWRTLPDPGTLGGPFLR